MSSALMKDLHLCPMDLLVFIFSPNMVSMRSPDTVAHVSYSMWHWYMSARSREVMEAGMLFSNCEKGLKKTTTFNRAQASAHDTSSSRLAFISNQAKKVSTSQEGYITFML